MLGIWQQLHLLAQFPEQLTYELIRPVVLFGHSPAERAQQTGAPVRTLSRQAARFEREGMANLCGPPKVERHRTPAAEPSRRAMHPRRGSAATLVGRGDVAWRIHQESHWRQAASHLRGRDVIRDRWGGVGDPTHGVGQIGGKHGCTAAAAATRTGRARGGGPTRQSARPTPQIVCYAIVSIAFTVGVAIVGIFMGVREEHAASDAAATRIATFNDGDYAAVDVSDLATDPDLYKQKPIQLRGEVTRIEKVHFGTYVLLSVKTRGGTQRWSVWVQYGGALPGVATQAAITVFGVGDGVEGGRNAWAGRDPHLVVRADRVVPSP
ncbi:MAG: hypothetical protein M3008_13190 [Chloroflexota bacterium]|nr:hypothetical protein [Chloroflexota bacterium]